MSFAGIPLQYPGSYIGKHVNIVPIMMFFREPTTTDKKFRIGTIAVLGNNPTTGTKGDLWYLSEFNSSGDAIWLQLLTGAGSAGVDSITTDDGADAVEPDGNGNINILGGNGCTVTGNGPGDTVTVDVTSTLATWTVIQDATKTIVATNGYFADRGAGVTFTLPATASVGDKFVVSTIDAGGFTIAQNASQDIRMGELITTSGVGGSLASTSIGDKVEIICYAANNNFLVLSSMGSITVV